MKVKISIPQIFSKQITHPRTDADEIYLAYFVTLAKAAPPGGAEVRKYVSKKVSAVKKGVKKQSKWTPESMETIVETGDATALFLSIALYEYDDGAIHKKLVKSSDVLVNPEDFDWSYVELPSNLTDWFGWVKSVWKLVVGTYNYLRQDDLIGDFSTVIKLSPVDTSEEGWTGLRELKFRQFGSDYRVSLKLELVE